MLRLDDLAEETYVSAAIYGKPGTGKTNFGVSAPKPLILLTERQALVHIKAAAVRLGKPCPPVVFCESVQDLRDVIRACRGDKKKPFAVRHKFKGKDGVPDTDEVVLTLDEWPETLVLDSGTDAGRLMTESIDRESPPRAGSDGLPTHTQNYWGVLGTRFGSFVRDFRSLPMHRIILCLADDKEVGEGEARTRWLGPSLPMRRLADDLAASVNVVGYTYRRVKREKRGESVVNTIHYGVLTVGPEYAVTKPFRPLRDAEVPDFTYWLKVINGTTQPTQAPALPGELDAGGEQPVKADTGPEPEVEAPAPEAEKPKAAAKTRKVSK